MRKTRLILPTLCVLPAVLFAGLADDPSAAKLAEVKASDYPSLSDRELGHLRWIVKLAAQPPGDWANMSTREAGQEGMEAYRYQLAFMNYCLALAQYHKTPAYRELYQSAMDSSIQKMLRKDVWGYWAEVSKGGRKYDPDLINKGPGEIDPVGNKNIMYSGHLLSMAALYQMLSSDAKYDRPASLTFVWDWMQEATKFEYDMKSLAEAIHKQFVHNPWHTVECEVNVVFPMCNMQPLFAFMVFDATHGTRLSSVKELVKKQFEEKRFLDPQTKSFMLNYQIKQDHINRAVSAGVDGWTGALMHAWDPHYIEALYTYWVKRYVQWAPHDVAMVPDKMSNLAGLYFALLAKEVGDTKTADAILRWVDTLGSPVWENGMFHYPRNDQRGIPSVYTVLAAAAEMNVKDGIFALANKPWDGNYFSSPYISGVDHRRVAVRQAYYDAQKQVLVISLEAGVKAAGDSSFRVNNLNPAKVYAVAKDGRILGYLKKGIVQSRQGGKGLEWNADRTLTIRTDLAKRHLFVILGH